MSRSGPRVARGVQAPGARPKVPRATRARLVVVSNRVASMKDPARAGGLAVALLDALRRSGGVWFGWSGEISERERRTPKLQRHSALTIATLDLTSDDYEDYYNGFANSTLWPLFHYRLDLATFDREHYQGYVKVNQRFAHTLLPLLEAGDHIWVHDYHLMACGEELRRMGCSFPMGFFLHIPFPPREVLTALPTHDVLVRALFSYDVIGFQTEGDRDCFFDYVVKEAGGRILGDDRVQAYGREIVVAVFPIGIDAGVFTRYASTKEAGEHAARMRRVLNNRQAILGVDRLDYSKGLPERFRAFERLLANYPENRGRVSYIQIAPRSRSDVQDYIDIRHELESLSGSINSEYSEFDWTPLRYINRSFTRRALAGLFRIARIGLVTPLRDGMNLVAKEYVAAQSPRDPGRAGALALRRGGAARRRRHHRQPLRCPGRRGCAPKGAQHAARGAQGAVAHPRRGCAPRRRDGLARILPRTSLRDAMTRLLAVDLGGTHIRFRLLENGAWPAPVQVVESGGVGSFEDALEQWREQTGIRGEFDAIGIAAAGPVTGGRVRVTNLDWTLDARAIERDCNARRCLLVNDVTAIAWALPSLGREDLRTLAAGSPDDGAARAVLAPGTGLGVSGLVPAAEGGFAAIEGEGGHRTLSAHDAREWAIVAALARRFGHASAERALSGPGIEATWRAIAAIDGKRCERDKTAAEIARDAFAGHDPIAVETISAFTGFLGSVAGDLALTLGARAGVFIAGGIVPGWGERFDERRFLERFRAKGRFRDYLSAVPVHVVSHPYPGLAGAERLLEAWGWRKRLAERSETELGADAATLIAEARELRDRELGSR